MAYRVETNAEPIPGYRLIERLGGGGFGEVWKAEAPGGFHKAIKFVYGNLDDCGDEGMRAEQELKSLSRVKSIRHPYILSLERYEVVDGQLCIVMELADRNLWDRFKECRVEGLPGIPREELLNYVDEIAEALDLMNIEHGLQHLDIKPQNLFLVHNHIKIADFGLVKDLEGMVAKVTGGVTPIYAAPETFDGWVSRFSDQYSLAIVYQELLTGHRPYSGTNVRQLIVQHMSGTPDLSSLPAGDRPTIARALAKSQKTASRPAARWSSRCTSCDGPRAPPPAGCRLWALLQGSHRQTTKPSTRLPSRQRPRRHHSKTHRQMRKTWVLPAALETITRTRASHRWSSCVRAPRLPACFRPPRPIGHAASHKQSMATASCIRP